MTSLPRDAPSAEAPAVDTPGGVEAAAPERPRLCDRLPPGGTTDSDEILDLFLGWAIDAGFALYPAQEEGVLELMAGRHVILNTPTGSGKSLVALAMHFKGLCEGRTSFYTSPIKALASEKFFALCDLFGPENVGMQTGDASINPQAGIICCTAEVLSNRALRQWDDLEAGYVVMDEFHYYSDPDRGVAWQVPLLVMPRTRFLLMSATLGNTAPIAERLEKQSGIPVALVYADERPVPLDYEYRETPLHETVEYLLAADKAPIYVVNFTQRECAELAQSLTSVKLCSRDERKRIKEALGDFRFDTPYGKEMRRFLGFGVGIHHAGLLPKYRLLVEQLAQQGMLKVICGTDTLGVGVNIPIRTVLFTKLSKYDGEKITLLKVRDFQQIAGRAGRKGFDDRGSVVCQAPEHVVEREKARQRATSARQRRKAESKKRLPPGFVSWNQETFDSLVARPPEILESRFRLRHGMVLDLLQHDSDQDDPERDNFASLRTLIDRCHEKEGTKRRLIGQAAMLVRSLNRAGVIRMKQDTQSGYYWAVVEEDLQWDFSLHQALSLYMVEAIAVLEPSSPDYALDIVTLVEAILESPRVVLRAQIHKLKGELIARLKAEGVHYEERMERLEEVTHPQPNRQFIEATFQTFRTMHPWVRGEDIRPKSIGRELYENYARFDDYVRRYGLQRSEGVLLRYLSQLYKTLDQSVPERAKTEGVYDIVGFFRTMLERIDSSLLEEWESMLHPEMLMERSEQREEKLRALRAYELFHDPNAFRARVRAELHALVQALAREDYEEAAAGVRPPTEGDDVWTVERFAAALAPFLESYGPPIFNHEARQAQHTRIQPTGNRTWEVSQVLVDRDGDNLWFLDAVIDLRGGASLEGPLIVLRRIGA